METWKIVAIVLGVYVIAGLLLALYGVLDLETPSGFMTCRCEENVSRNTLCDGNVYLQDHLIPYSSSDYWFFTFILNGNRVCTDSKVLRCEDGEIIGIESALGHPECETKVSSIFSEIF
ncbi:hypothetical protein GOV11_05100 [Candidatus Woesearchaeota archaeon]|nr:hypothetical protein [Candidatus Woesearchaeota archaeon]